MSISVAIVIPVYREDSYIERTLHSIEKSVQYSIEKLLIPKVVLVINNPIGVSTAFKNDNQVLIRKIMDLKNYLSYPVDVLDYTEPGLKNGVGEARKIGMDYAISKYLSDPFDRIVSLDADCLVSDNYITTLFQNKLNGVGFTLYFEHELDSEAIVYYELYLRYLRWGLEEAWSPFAFYSVGSCMGTTVETYQKIGGMVAKSATEDFHFLNKMRRQGPIDYWTSCTIRPSTRFSERVTLGTGYFLSNARYAFEKSFQKLLIPSPKHFQQLKIILSIFQSYDGSVSLQDKFKQQDLMIPYQHLHEHRVIEKIYKIAETTTNPKNYQQRLMEVIDGLETLRILRNMWLTENPMTFESFLAHANTLWKTQLPAKELLLEIRKKELSER
jgi:glycosyltransferase involved in cell wall biosynthesis